MVYRSPHTKKAAFLAAYRTSGIIGLSCKAAGVGRTMYYRWTEHDASFALKAEQAKGEAIELLEAEARRRAFEGVTKRTGVYYLGTMVGEQVETSYSDVLLIFLLKGLKPEMYRERVDLRHSGEVNNGDTLSDEERAQIRAIISGRAGDR